MASNDLDKVSAQFWSEFLKAIHDQGVKAPYDRWYVRRAEQYIEAYPGQSLDQHRGENVQSYLEDIGRKQTLADWQYWKDSAQSLESGHATIARDTPPDPAPARQRQRTGDDRGVNAIRRQHGELITKLVVEIRRRAYSIRTEQAYEQWVCRFIAFSKNRDPRELCTERGH